MKHLRTWVEAVGALADRPGDGDERRLQHRFLIVTAVAMSFGGLVWGTMAVVLALPVQATIPFGYTALTVVNLTYLQRTKNFAVARAFQVLMSLVLPYALQWTLGGFVASGCMMSWALLSLTASQSFGNARTSLVWLGAFLGLMVVSVAIDPHLPVPEVMESARLTRFAFAINISTVSITVFGLTSYFLHLRHLSAVELARKNRQIAESQQALVQSEKMAALGRLSAGMAHEMNNPASAARRGASHLERAIHNLRGACFELGRGGLESEQLARLSELEERAQQRVRSPLELEPLERSDREVAIDGWFDDRDLDPPEDPSVLVEIGVEIDELDDLRTTFGPTLSLVLGRVASWYTIVALLGEIGHGSERIIGLVKALKSYTYLDEAPVQSINVNDGIEDTLVMMQGLLKRGVSVQRDLARDLPCIEGRGSELNQVWTNLIDNAVAAMRGEGEIDVVTRRDRDEIVVEIADSGPGIPAELQPRIFDPFVTTKPVGKGTGLGLNISRNIVVEKHGGTIAVDSEPGRTRFSVRLPIQAADCPPGA